MVTEQLIKLFDEEIASLGIDFSHPFDVTQEKALADDRPEVRAAAAAALGDLKSKGSVPMLEKALDDDDPSVALAAAHALDLMHDDSAYDVYYEILTGQRRSGKGLVASQTAMLKDPKKVAQLGFEEGIGFIPFAGIGWEAIKVIKKDDSSPIRAADSPDKRIPSIAPSASPGTCIINGSA